MLLYVGKIISLKIAAGKRIKLVSLYEVIFFPGFVLFQRGTFHIYITALCRPNHVLPPLRL